MLEAAAERLVRRADRPDLFGALLQGRAEAPAGRRSDVLERPRRHPARAADGDRQAEEIEQAGQRHHARPAGERGRLRQPAAAARRRLRRRRHGRRRRPAAATRATTGSPARSSADDPSSVPTPLLILGGLALLLVAAGAAGLIAKRIQSRRPGTENRTTESRNDRAFGGSEPTLARYPVGSNRHSSALADRRGRVRQSLDPSRFARALVVCVEDTSGALSIVPRPSEEPIEPTWRQRNGVRTAGEHCPDPPRRARQQRRRRRRQPRRPPPVHDSRPRPIRRDRVGDPRRVHPRQEGPAFEQRSVEFPKFWSQTATNIVAQKYFRGRMSSPSARPPSSR